MSSTTTTNHTLGVGEREGEGRETECYCVSNDTDRSSLRCNNPTATKSNEIRSTSAPTNATARSLTSRDNAPSKTDIRKLNRMKRNGVVAATQNFRGGLQDEDKVEEVMIQMRRQGIDLICGQEAGLQQEFKSKRWDTGELLISCGKSGSNRAKASGCYFLSAELAEVFVRGGSKLTRHGDRLSTIILPLNKRTIHVINSHFPDSAHKKKNELQEYRTKVDTVLRNVNKKHLLLWMGDFNASTGTSSSDDDTVCGPFGNPHSNQAGRELKTIAALYGLKDVGTFTDQHTWEGTWVHPRSKQWHQLDKIFMRDTDMSTVNKCYNAAMIADSDHYSVRINITLNRRKSLTLSLRQKRNGRDFDSTFGKQAHVSTTLTALKKIKSLYQSDRNADDYTRLMTAVNSVTADLPRKRSKISGWCDVNFDRIADKVQARNLANETYANTKTAESKEALRVARKNLKLAKKQERNLWLLEQVKQGNRSLLPGHNSASDSKQMWQFVKKVKRGLSKWHSNFDNNVQDKLGKLATSAEQNAENFKSYFDDLYCNLSDRNRCMKHYARMATRPVERCWLPPTMSEMKQVLTSLKDVAAGESGIPPSMWRSFIHDDDLLTILLSIMRQCWCERKVPKDWNKLYMSVLAKPGPGKNMSLLKNYRGISIAEVLSKVYTGILKLRLEPLYESIAPEFCCGFRRGRGRNDSVYTVKEQLRRRKEWGLESYVVFWDVKRCFDRIPKQHIWTSMSLLGIDNHMIDAVKSTLHETTCSMVVDGIPKTINMIDGSGQGTTLGPMLCNFFFLPILKLWINDMADVAPHLTSADGQQISTFISNFADDTAMMVSTFSDMELIVKRFPIFLRDFGVEVHTSTSHNEVSKSSIIHIPANVSQSTNCACEPVPIANPDGITTWVTFQKSARYLGAIITSDLKDDDEIRGRIDKATGLFGSLRQNLLASKDVWNEVKRRIMIGMVLPTLLDGAENWIISASLYNELTAAYNKMIRSCLRMTTHTQRIHRVSTQTMLLKLGMEPLQYYLDWKILGYAGHIARMPPHRLPFRTATASIPGPRPRGAPSKTHKRQIRQCLKRKNLLTDDWVIKAQNRNQWRAAITAILPYPMKKSKIIPSWVHNPEEIINCYVEKLFGSKYYVGTITNIDVDEKTNDQLWCVVYDDGDTADYDKNQIQKILCNDETHVF